MLKYDIVRPADHKGWLEERGKGIGSSEAPVISGISFYKETPISIWRRKTGLDAPKPETSYMTAGHEFEPCIPMMFSRRTGAIIDPSSEGDWIAVNRQKPWQRVSPDRLFYPARTPAEQQTYENACLLECKTTSKAINKNDLPLYWKIQVTYQMAVLGLKKAVIGWISYYGGLSFDFAEYEFNQDMWNFIEENIDKFWNENIVKNRCPEQVFNASDVLTRFPSAGSDTKVVADETMLDLWGKRMQYGQQKDDLEKELEAIDLEVKSFMKDNETLVDNQGNILVTWKNANVGGRFKEKEFKEKYPDLWSEFHGEGTTTRRISFKPIKDKQSA